MPNIITLKVDVRKLDKSRFFEGKEDQNGHRPLYADLVLIARKEVGRFGDTHIVKQSKKKDENIELPIIGNATDRREAPQQQESSEPYRHTTMNRSAPAASSLPLDEDVPF